MSTSHPVETDDNGARKVAKGDAAWRAELTREQYCVLRRHGTERSCISGVAPRFKPEDG
jgi:peptide methionine sulfoxide reductase MsrB